MIETKEIMKIKLTEDFNCLLESDELENIHLLNDYIKDKTPTKYDLNKKSGIYAFWWRGEKEELIDAFKKAEYILKGSKNAFEVCFTEDWAEASTVVDKDKNNICLYVGKSTNIKKRISNHLKLRTEDIWKKKGQSEGVKPNSVSQLRIGLERVFGVSIFKQLIEEGKIGVSWMVLDGYENSINRFYLEDYYIGKYLPVFNVDIER